MRAIDALGALLLIVAGGAATVAIVRHLLRASAPWRAESHTRPDGTVEISVRRPGEQPRLVRAIPPGLDAVDFVADVELAMEDAQQQADVLNRRR